MVIYIYLCVMGGFMLPITVKSNELLSVLDSSSPVVSIGLLLSVVV